MTNHAADPRERGSITPFAYRVACSRKISIMADTTYTSQTQSRKWQLTINNPDSAGLDDQTLIDQIHTLVPDYFCKADEIAKTGTPHVHIFIYRVSPLRFGTIKKAFPTAHIEKAYGSSADNRNYIRKEGKWSETDKAETKVAGSFYEEGSMPSEREEKDPVKAKIMEMVENGSTNTEILKEYPTAVFRGKDIDYLRNTLMADRFRIEMRLDLEVTYLYGEPGTGKTRSIYDRHPIRDICRITTYNGSLTKFDNYNGEDVLVLEEYDSDLPITMLLNVLDIYPLMLPARYSDKIACYTKVYIISNLSLSEQYEYDQYDHPLRYKALLRRIHNIVRVDNAGNFIVEQGKW